VDAVQSTHGFDPTGQRDRLSSSISWTMSMFRAVLASSS
jgi:hypothetical protein